MLSNSSQRKLPLLTPMPPPHPYNTRSSQSAVAEVSSASALAATGAGSGPNLRALLLAGDFFLGGVVAGTQVKLLLRLKALKETPGASGLELGMRIWAACCCSTRCVVPLHTPMHTRACPPVVLALPGARLLLLLLDSATLTLQPLLISPTPRPPTGPQLNAYTAEAMQYVVATLRLGEAAGATPTPLDADSRDRMMLCLRVLAGQDTWSNEVRTGCAAAGGCCVGSWLLAWLLLAWLRVDAFRVSGELPGCRGWKGGAYVEFGARAGSRKRPQRLANLTGGSPGGERRSFGARQHSAEPCPLSAVVHRCGWRTAAPRSRA